MDGELTCEDCGGRLRWNAATPGGWVRCPTCGGGARVPPEAITTEKHVGFPCPECGADMAAGAVLCGHCGYHRGKGRRLKTTRKRIRLVWSSRNTLGVRLGIFAAVLIGCGAFWFGCLRDGNTALMMWPVPAAVVAGLFLLTPLGPRFRIVLERDPTGRFRLSRRQWFCLIPVGAWSILLEEKDKAYIGFTQRGRYQGHGYVTLEIARDRDEEGVVVYKGYDERLMQDIADGLREVAGVRLERR